MLFEINRNYNDAISKYGENHIIGTFLYGSQNYNLATSTSDVDTRTLIIPSFNDIVLSNKEIAIEKCLDDGSHSNIEDIRHFARALRKQNICFLEILSCVQENTYHFSNRMNLVFNRYVPYIKNIVYTI